MGIFLFLAARRGGNTTQLNRLWRLYGPGHRAERDARSGSIDALQLQEMDKHKTLFRSRHIQDSRLDG